MRAGGKCYNVTSHFEMCMVNFNFACEVVTALQAKNYTYMLGTNSVAAIGSPLANVTTLQAILRCVCWKSISPF